MPNPITHTRHHLVLYFLFWAVVAALYSVVLAQTQPLPWQSVLTEALVHTTVLGFIGLAIWYVVRYAGIGVGELWRVLINHLAAAVLLLLIWLWVSHVITAWLLGEPLALRELSRTQLGLRLALGLVGYGLVALNYYLLIYYEGYRSQQVNELEMRNVLRETELSMLKAQLNPHFIFNSLNSISSLTLTRPEDAHEMIVKLSTFLRYTLSNPETGLVPLKQELDTTRLYLDIEMLRFGNRLAVIWEGEEELPEGILMPHLLLQPLVENAIKHGVYERLEGSTLRLHLTQQGTDLVITLSNPTGDTPKRPTGKGIGLQNVQSRLAHHYERNDLLQARRHEDEYTVTLRIPQL